MMNRQQVLEHAYMIKQELRDLEQMMMMTNTMSLFDMFGGGMMTSMLKRGGMTQIEQKFYRIQDLCYPLRDYGIYFINRFDGHTGQYMDVLFDNIFSDMANQGRLSVAQEQIRRLQYDLDVLIVRLQSDTHTHY